MKAIEIRNLTKEFRKGLKGWVKILQDLSLDVEKGEVFGFLGPNGAGKTTTIKILMGLIFPTSGSARILSQDIRDRTLRRRVGFLPENPHFHSHLSAMEFMDLYAHLFGINSGQSDEIEALLRRVGLWSDRHLLLNKFSKGMIQRLGIAQAIMNDPEVVILDEPMAGLDPLGRNVVADIICKMKEKGKAVFFSSHILPDVENICDRVGVLVNGELKAIGRVDDLLGDRKGTLEEAFIDLIA